MRARHVLCSRSLYHSFRFISWLTVPIYQVVGGEYNAFGRPNPTWVNAPSFDWWLRIVLLAHAFVDARCVPAGHKGVWGWDSCSNRSVDDDARKLVGLRFVFDLIDGGLFVIVMTEWKFSRERQKMMLLSTRDRERRRLSWLRVMDSEYQFSCFRRCF